MTFQADARDRIRAKLDAEPEVGPTSQFVPGASGRPSAASQHGGGERSEPLQFIDPCAWHGKAVPPRRWIVDSLLPVGQVTMLNGDGGLGKSTLAMQLMAAAAVGRQWLGFNVMSCRSLGVFCEDAADELHARMADIVDHLDVGFLDLKPMTLSSRVGLDNVLVATDRYGKNPKATALYHDIRRQAVGFGAQLVILDSLHDLFGGNENSRVEARHFIGLLRRLAMDIDGAVLLCAHPSVAGMQNGSGSSGNTAWNNAVRSRLYLTRPPVTAEDDDADLDARQLKTMKANYGRAGGKIALRWSRGVFVREGYAGTVDGQVARIEMDGRMLAALRAMIENGSMVAADPAARTGFATVVRQHSTCRQYGFKDAVAAQERLLNEKKIERVEMGPPSKRRLYLRPVEMRYPGEGGGVE